MALFSLAQAHQRFKILYDKVDSFNSPEFGPEEIDEFLNIAQDDLIRLIAAKGFESNQDLSDYLKNLTTSAVILESSTDFISGTSTKENGWFIILPPSYHTALFEEIELTYTECDSTVTRRSPVYPITRDRYNKLKRDPFNKPDKETTFRLVSSSIGGSDSFELIIDPTATPVKYIIDYIRKPLQITYGSQYAVQPTADVNCELDDKAYYRIIDLAVDRALDTMRLKQTKPQTTQ